MYNHLILSGYLFIVGFAIAYICTPLMIYLAVRFNVFDRPGPRKLHEQMTPLLGGVAIFFSFLLVIVVHMIIASNLSSNFDKLQNLALFPSYLKDFSPNYTRLSIFFGGAFLMLLIGLIDDITDLSVAIRFTLEFIVATIVMASGLRLEFDLASPWVEIISVIWIVGITNSFNLLDGADGLSCGVAIICSIGLSLCLVVRGTFQPLVSLLVVCFGGCCMGFLPYNFPRARAFLGSAGSMFIGYMLGVSVLMSSFMNVQSFGIKALAIPLFMLTIPLYDTLSVIFIRLKNKKSIFQGDFNHFVHRLMRKGYSPRKSVVIIYLLTIITLSNAFFLIMVKPDYYVIILQVLLCFTILLAIEKINVPGGVRS